MGITHPRNNAIWLALRPCHMTMMHKINKLEKPGGPQGNFHALFGRSPTFYGHFRADVVTSQWSTCILSSPSLVGQKSNSHLVFGVDTWKQSLSLAEASVWIIRDQVPEGRNILMPSVTAKSFNLKSFKICFFRTSRKSSIKLNVL